MSDKPYQLVVVMPVYNEAEAIAPVLRKWCAMLDTLGLRYRIRAYNDGSKDATGQILQREAEASGGRVLAIDKPNGGHGPTILQGYREAAAEADWVFQIDSDDEMAPDSFPALWAKREAFDFLVGRRSGRRQPLARKVISFVSRGCVRLFYGRGVWDVNTPYRLMRAAVFAPLYAAIPANTFAPNVILSGLAARLNLRAFEMPVPQHDRTTGEVSIKKWELLKAAARSFAQTIAFAFARPFERTPPLLCGLWVVFAAGVVASAFVTPSWNDADYNIQAVNLMAKGLLPLRDFDCMYTQLSYWLMFPLRLGVGAKALHTVVLLVLGLFSVGMMRSVYVTLTRRAVPMVWAHLAALLVFAGTAWTTWSYAMEPWAAIFGMLALQVVFAKQVTPRTAALAGCLGACAYLSRQNAGIYLVVVALALCVQERWSWKRLFAFGGAVAGTFLLYLVLMRLALGDWCAWSTFIGQVHYNRSVTVAKAEALRTLKFLASYAFLPLLLACWTGLRAWREKLPLAVGLALMLLAVRVSPGLHNLFLAIPFVALLFGFSRPTAPLRSKGHLVILALVIAGVLMQGAVCSKRLIKRYWRGITSYCQRGSLYSTETLRVVQALRAALTPGDRLFILPRGDESVSQYYLLTDATPANLTVQHNDNLFWGTEFWGDNGQKAEVIRSAIERATLICILEPSTHQPWLQTIAEAGFSRIPPTEGLCLMRRSATQPRRP